jgi:hypothetical protein
MAARMPPPQGAYAPPYQAPFYYAPVPEAPTPTPGSTATAPTGVYPTNTVPAQLGGPQSLPPQVTQPLVSQPLGRANPQPGVPAQAQGAAAPRSDPTDPRQPQRVAMNTSDRPRLYSVHREFGMTPDPDPLPGPATGPAVELISPIDSGVNDPPTDNAPAPQKPRTASAAEAAALRGGYSNDPQN